MMRASRGEKVLRNLTVGWNLTAINTLGREEPLNMGAAVPLRAAEKKGGRNGGGAWDH